MSTDVDTRMGKVTSTGSADTAAAKELAGSLAKNTSGVVAVDSQLTVRASSATAASANAPAPEAHVVSDAWISTNVRSTLM